MVFNPQRIRDTIHNIIGFEGNQFENMLWELINTRPFQRLRRVKQLGFSDLVYPGATHSRFAHSVGVFHIARRMMKIIERHLGENSFQEAQAQHALAAALLHDVGHGAFSHAFETVGKRLNIEMAKHETVSKKLVLDSEITDCLKKMGRGFHEDVANVIDDDVSATLYSAVISSQFDADRLDYIQRDRMMCGTGHGAIDFEWLVENIQVGEVQLGVDDEQVGKQQTFVIGPKAIAAAETFVFGLFQLYPTVYFHKTTRGAEKLFTELLVRVIELGREDGSSAKTGLPENHPLVQFAKDSDSIDNVLCLDDSVVWSALNLLADSDDKLIANFSDRLRRRKLYKVIDVREEFRKQEKDEDALDISCAEIKIKIEEWAREDSSPFPRILVDDCERSPYKKYKEEKGPLNQINVLDNGKLHDLSEVSDVVGAIKDFKAFRVYVDGDDEEAKNFIKKEIEGI